MTWVALATRKDRQVLLQPARMTMVFGSARVDYQRYEEAEANFNKAQAGLCQMSVRSWPEPELGQYC
jgi:hypothetical protein